MFEKQNTPKARPGQAFPQGGPGGPRGKPGGPQGAHGKREPVGPLQNYKCSLMGPPGQARPGQARRGADPRRIKASLATKPRLTIRNLSGIYPDSNDYLYQGQGLGPWPGLELWARLAFLAKKHGPTLVGLIEKRETRLCDTNITHSI